MPERPQHCAFDTVTLANFALADSLPLLAERYRGRGAVTVEVLDELDYGVSRGHAVLAGIHRLLDARVLSLVTLTAKERLHFVELRRHLGRGEASAIAVARSRHWAVATDDRAARQTCRSLAVPLTGTVGILAAICREGRLARPEADDVLRRMVAAGFHSPVRSVPAVL